MADKELKKLTRRELLQMLLVQCEESERLQRELDELTMEHEAMSESYERLKSKLNVKDERLNQKDAKIAALVNQIKEMKASRFIELTEAGSIAEAALRLNGIFEAAQQAADQYLMNIRKLGEVEQHMLGVQEPDETKQQQLPDRKTDETKPEDKKNNRIPFQSARRPGIRRTTGPRVRQILKAVSGDGRG